MFRNVLWTPENPMLESRALSGAGAQLGERRVRNAKVEGSIPFRSTIFRGFVPTTSVGCDRGRLGRGPSWG